MKKKRYKKRHRLCTNDVNLALFTIVFEEGNVYAYDYHKKRQVKGHAHGNSLWFPKGKYLHSFFTIEFFEQATILKRFGCIPKKHMLDTTLVSIKE